MAKVTGPLMSMSASGKFGGTLVFANNKGRDVVRQLVTPANPRTTLQVTVRNALSVAAAIQKWINRTLLEQAAIPIGDEARLRQLAPSGTVWNAYVTQLVVGQGQANYASAGVAWAAATQSSWETAATALTPPYAPLSLPNPTGSGFVTVSPGEQFFRHQYMLFVAGALTSAPSAPPTYA
jgi:hypothetical protein